MKRVCKLLSALLPLCLLAACGAGPGGSSVSVAQPSSSSSLAPVSQSEADSSVPSVTESSSPAGSGGTETSSDPAVQPEAPLGYEEYFSEEREFWLYLRPQDSPYNWIHYETEGILRWDGPGASKRVAENVTRLLVGSEAVYYIVNETQLYGAALDNSWNHLVYESAIPIDTVWGNAEIVFFEVDKTVYRHHVVSGITDVFYELGPKDILFVPYSNHSIWWGEVVWEDGLGNTELEYKYYSALTQTVTEPPEDYRFRVGIPFEEDRQWF